MATTGRETARSLFRFDAEDSDAFIHTTRAWLFARLASLSRFTRLSKVWVGQDVVHPQDESENVGWASLLSPTYCMGGKLNAAWQSATVA